MSEAVNSGRSANKRAVIDIRGDESNEPPVKKEAQPVPTQEVLELQQKLQQTKTEKKLEGAICLAGVAQARVEYLENLIDKKPATIDEREKKIEELSSKLVEADGREKKLADEMQNTIDKLTAQVKDDRKLYDTTMDNWSTNRKILADELDDERKKTEELTINRDELERKLSLADEKEKKLVEEQQKKVNSLIKQLEVEKRRAKEDQKKISELTINRDELEHKLADIEQKIQMEEQQKKIDELSRRRNALKKRVSAADDIEHKLVAESKKKMDELRNHRAQLARELAEIEQKKMMAEEQQIKKTRKLNQNEGGQQQQQPNQRQPFQAVQQPSDNVSLKKAIKTQIVSSTSDSPLVNTGRTNNSSDIFEIHSTVDPTRGALRFDFAVEVLTEQNKKTFKSYGSSKEEYAEYAEKRKEVLKDEKLHCAYCKKTCEKEEILSHFLSTQHIKKVKECHRIATTAFISYDAVKYWINKLESIEKQQPTAVAAAAHDGSSSDKKETKKENRVVTMQEREDNNRISE